MPTLCEYMVRFFRGKYAFTVCFILFIIWQLPGIVPFISYEGDAVSISMGCEYTYSHGWHTLGDEGYGYWMQPLAYILIVAIKHLLPSCGCEEIYSVVSSMSCVGCQLLIIVFAHRLMGLNKLAILFSLLLIPESYALGMYPNTTAIAVVFFMGGVCLIQRRNTFYAFVLLMIAPFVRLDVLMIYPVIPVIMSLSGCSWGRSISISLGFGMLLAIFILLFFPLLGADVFKTMTEYSRWNSIITYDKNLLAIIGFYGIINIFLVPIGYFVLCKKGRWEIVFLITIAVLLVHLFNFRFGNASKHFALLLPFVSILVAIGVEYFIRTSNNVLSVVLGLAVFCYLFIGCRFIDGVNSYPQARLNRYVPTLICLKSGTLEICLGGGQPAMTADETMIFSGQFFYPWYVHNLKNENLSRQERLIQSLHDNPDDKMVIATWEESQRLKLFSIIHGLEMDNVTYDEELSKFRRGIRKHETQVGLCRYVNKVYGNHADVKFVCTESISHAWDKMVSIVEKELHVKTVR